MKPTHKIRLVTEDQLIREGYRFSRDYLRHSSRQWMYRKDLDLLGREHEVTLREGIFTGTRYRLKTGPAAHDYWDIPPSMVMWAELLSAPPQKPYVREQAPAGLLHDREEATPADESVQTGMNRRMRRIQEAANRSGRTLSIEALQREAFAERPPEPAYVFDTPRR